MLGSLPQAAYKDLGFGRSMGPFGVGEEGMISLGINLQ